MTIFVAVDTVRLSWYIPYLDTTRSIVKFLHEEVLSLGSVAAAVQRCHIPFGYAGHINLWHYCYYSK